MNGFEINSAGFRIWSPHNIPSDQEKDGNIDIHVYCDDGTHFVGTFFTLENIRWLMEKNRKTGECASGLYTWSTGMVILRELSKASIETVVRDLLKTGHLGVALEGPIDNGDATGG